jgi:hypothetical protein
MPRFYFELKEDGVIVRSHYGLELHEVAVNDLDTAVDLAHLLAKRAAADSENGPVVVTISDEARNPFARITLSSKNGAAMGRPAAANAPPIAVSSDHQSAEFDGGQGRGTPAVMCCHMKRSHA